MHRLLSFIFFAFLFGSSARAQRIIDTTTIDFGRYRGALLTISEMHGVRASNLVYFHFLQKLAAHCGPGDTINLFLETPYSLAWMHNEYLRNGAYSELHNDSSLVPMIRRAGLPVRIFGCDFEYDRGGNRAMGYQIFLGEAARRLTVLGVDAGLLGAYADRLRKDSVWQQPEGRKSLIQALRKQHAATTNAEAKTLLREALFVLTAVQHFHRHRDPVLYRRILEASEAGLLHPRGRYNLLVHGGTHLEPHWKGSLFHYLDTRKASPFRNQTYLIVQAYLDCHSTGDYFHPNADLTSSNVPFAHYGKQRDAFLDWMRGHIANGMEPNTILAVRRIDYPIPALQAHANKVLLWYVLNRCR